MATSYITDFIQSLSSEELKFTKKHISSESKTQRLLTLLTDAPEEKFSDGDLANLLNVSNQSIRVLKSRLFEKVTEVLLLDNHFKNSVVFNYRETVVFTAKKKMLLAKSIYRLLNQKKVTTVIHILEEVLEISTENEIYDVLVEALNLYNHIIGIRKGIEKFEKNIIQINFYENCLKAVRDADNEYHRYIINQEFIHSQPAEKVKAYLNTSIRKMEIDYKNTNAQQVNYYIYIFKVILLEWKKNYEQAIILYKKFILIIKRSKILYSKDRIGFATGNLGNFNLLLSNYKQALSYFKKAEKFHIPNSRATTLLKEHEFYCHFYLKNYAKSSECVNQLFKYMVDEIGTFRQSKFAYQKANIFFATKRYSETLHLLNKSMEIEKDKGGLNVSIRILLIMTFIELNKHKEAKTSIAASRKYIERNRRLKEIKQRDILILKLLIELEKDGFKRRQKNKNVSKILTELSNKDKPTAWKHLTPELIPFHEWVMTLPVKTN